MRIWPDPKILPFFEVIKKPFVIKVEPRFLILSHSMLLILTQFKYLYNAACFISFYQLDFSLSVNLRTCATLHFLWNVSTAHLFKFTTKFRIFLSRLADCIPDVWLSPSLFSLHISFSTLNLLIGPRPRNQLCAYARYFSAKGWDQVIKRFLCKCRCQSIWLNS